MGIAFGAMAQAQVEVSDAYVRGLPPGQQVTAAFLHLLNRGSQAVALESVVSNVASRVEIHTHIERDGMMRMQKLDRITLPVGELFSFRPGGYHLMLFGLKQTLHAEDKVELTLRFSSGQQLSLSVPVRSVLDEHHHHH
jgi:hypothetical protein